MRNLFWIVLVIPLTGLAQTPSPAPSPIPPSVGWLESLIAMIPMEGASVVVAAFVINFIAQRWPSKNPQGILHWASYLCKKGSELLLKLAALSDKLLGQKLK